MKRLLTLSLLCAAVCSASTTYINRISQVLSLTGAQTNMVEWNVPYTPDAVVLTCTSGSVRVWAARAHNIVRIAGVATTNDSGAWLDTGASAKWCPDGYGTCWLASTGASAVVTLDVIGKRGDNSDEIQAALAGLPKENLAMKSLVDALTNAFVFVPGEYVDSLPPSQVTATWVLASGAGEGMVAYDEGLNLDPMCLYVMTNIGGTYYTIDIQIATFNISQSPTELGSNPSEYDWNLRISWIAQAGMMYALSDPTNGNGIYTNVCSPFIVDWVFSEAWPSTNIVAAPNESGFFEGVQVLPFTRQPYVILNATRLMFSNGKSIDWGNIGETDTFMLISNSTNYHIPLP